MLARDTSGEELMLGTDAGEGGINLGTDAQAGQEQQQLTPGVTVQKQERTRIFKHIYYSYPYYGYCCCHYYYYLNI